MLFPLVPLCFLFVLIFFAPADPQHFVVSLCNKTQSFSANGSHTVLLKKKSLYLSRKNRLTGVQSLIGCMTGQ